MNGKKAKTNRQEIKTINTEFRIPFSFLWDESFDSIVDRLDETLRTERNRAIEAIAKMKGVEVKFEDSAVKDGKIILLS